MNVRRKTRVERAEIKKAKNQHNKMMRLRPSEFEAARVDLASQVLTSATSAKRPPKWGSFTFKFKQEGQPLVLININ